MKRVAELERLGLLARQQAGLTTNRETRELLLKIARQYAMAAADRRAALEAGREAPQPP